MLVLKVVVDLHRTVQLHFFSITDRGIDLDYCDIEWFALKMYRVHSIVFEIASKYCISDSPGCREQAIDSALMTKLMRKEARHMQRRDRALGVPPDILEHLPPKNQSLPTLLLCALTSDFTGCCPPPTSRSLCQRVNLQLQLIKFLGN